MEQRVDSGRRGSVGAWMHAHQRSGAGSGGAISRLVSKVGSFVPSRAKQTAEKEEPRKARAVPSGEQVAVNADESSDLFEQDSEQEPEQQSVEESEDEPSEDTQAQLAVGNDGDGVLDVAVPLMLMVDADGDGVSDGLHADKLGVYVPQMGLRDDRPVYECSHNASLLLWWSAGRWYLGKREELGRNRGWLKVQGEGATPPETGWTVYSKADAAWLEMEGMIARPARERDLRVERLRQTAMSRFGKRELTRCFETWSDTYWEGAHRRELLRQGGLRLARPRLSRSYVHWRQDWTIERLHQMALSRLRKQDFTRVFEAWACVCLEGTQRRRHLRQAGMPLARPRLHYGYVHWREDWEMQKKKLAEQAATAVPLMLMVDADGDGVSDGLHADKLGVYVPQMGLRDDRPVYECSHNASLLLWWSAGRWYLGKREELGRNRGWLKVQGEGATPPETGWTVYSKADAAWLEMEGMIARPARERDLRVERLRQTAMSRFGKRELTRCFETWSDTYWEGAHRRELLRQGGLRLARPRLSRSYVHWRQDWNTQQKKLAEFGTRLARLKLAYGYVHWRQDWTTHQKKLVEQAAVAAAAKAARMAQEMAKAADAAEEARLAAEAEEREDRAEYLHEVAARRMAKAGVACGFEAWVALLQAAHLRKTAMLRLVAYDLARGFGSWVTECRNELLRKAALRRAVNLQLARGFDGWSNRYFARLQLGRIFARVEPLQRKAAHQLGARSLILGFETWASVHFEQMRLRCGAQRLVRPLLSAVLSASFTCWRMSWEANERKQAEEQMQARMTSVAERRAKMMGGRDAKIAEEEAERATNLAVQAAEEEAKVAAKLAAAARERDTRVDALRQVAALRLGTRRLSHGFAAWEISATCGAISRALLHQACELIARLKLASAYAVWQRSWKYEMIRSAEELEEERVAAAARELQEMKDHFLAGVGTREVRLDRASRASSLGIQVHTDKELDGRRLWGLPEIRLEGTCDPDCRTLAQQRAVIKRIDSDSAAATAGLQEDDVLLVINDHFHPSNVTFQQLMETLVGTIHIIARPLEHVLGPASKKKLLPPPTVALAAMPLKDWDNSPRPGVPTTKPQAEFSRSPTPSRSSSPRPTTPRRRKASPSRPTTRREEDRSSRFDAALADTRLRNPQLRPPVTPPKSPSGGVLLTARGMKSSLQLRKELMEVRKTIHTMEKRVAQALSVAQGTKLELLETFKSCQKSLHHNPSLTSDPRGPEAMAAAEAEVNEDKLRERYEQTFGAPPTKTALKVEMKLATSRAARLREEANKPVVAALAELEEIASLGAQTLERHEEKLQQLLLTTLPEQAQDLAAHYDAHDQVVKTMNRAAGDRLIVEATHECLRLATEQEDVARWVIGEALKAVRREKTAVEVCKADLQRASQEKRRILEVHKRNEMRGTTFNEGTRLSQMPVDGMSKLATRLAVGERI